MVLSEFDEIKFANSLRNEGRAEGLIEGEIRNACRSIRRSWCTVEEAAKDIGISANEFREKAEALSLSLKSV